MEALKCFIIFGLCCTTVLSQSTPCITPNGEQATCVSLLSCQILLESAYKNSLAKKFVEASACAEGSLQVCCGKFANFIPIQNENIKPINESNRDYVIRKRLLPTKTYCGLQHTDDYFYNETETSVDEFPWLVYMVIPDDHDNNFYLRKESNCVGVLISNLYVLTSYNDCYLIVHPFYHPLTTKIEMIFGQHHIYKDVSCIPTRFEVDDCTAPNVHGFSDESLSAPVNAIPALSSPFGLSILRLRDRIDFSDFVRPICLPLDPDDLPKPGDIVTTSGWGEQVTEDSKSVKLKKRIKYDVVENEECESGNPIPNPICGVPWENNTHYVCPADNGGPLMYKHKHNWILAGIVSKTKTCDDVHSVIAEGLTPETLEWIFKSIVYFEDKINSFKRIPLNY